MVVRAIGISWYGREDYPRARGIMIDAHVLPPNYEQWHRKARAQETRLQASGLTVIRAPIDPDNFLEWCKRQGLEPDAKGRIAFATDRAMSQVKGAH